MKEKIKPYYYALLIGSCNAIICGIFVPLYALQDGMMFAPNEALPTLRIYMIFIAIIVFLIQFWITSLVIVVLIRNRKNKSHSNLIVFAITFISSYAFVSLFGQYPMITAIKDGAIHLPLYILVSVVIYLLGFHFLIIRKIQEKHDLSTVEEAEDKA
ncbi:MAG: hypothetical protein JEZ06_12935 [Anaerolineaceae bacterium]|nr:hypothetical protein [Anaerolineaceae bacterium]